MAKTLSKVQARTRLRYAVKRGTLSRQPCRVCGTTPAQAHHTNYENPLDVEWLCSKHHMALHLSTIPCNRGTANGQAKLTPEQVADIRARYAAGRQTQTKYARGRETQRQLGRAYGISQSHVWKILQGQRWTPR